MKSPGLQQALINAGMLEHIDGFDYRVIQTEGEIFWKNEKWFAEYVCDDNDDNDPLFVPVTKWHVVPIKDTFQENYREDETGT